MKRLDKLKHILEKSGKFPYLITDMSDIFYISNFTGSTAYIFLTEKDNIFVTDGRYEVQSREELDDSWSIKIVSSYPDFLSDMIKKYKRVFVTESMGLGLYNHLIKDVELLIDQKNEISLLRAIKDEEEIKHIRKAYKIASLALENSLKVFKFGETERCWAAYLEYQMKVNGANRESFDTIIASGYRGALPHGVASDKIIEPENPVIIDYGADCRYVSDITRMIYNGKEREILDNLEIISDTVDLAIQHIKPGIKCHEIYDLSKKYLARYGLDVYFNHGLGHSLGIDVHEKPVLNAKDNTIIEENMIFTIEPGVYFPDKYGIRIEETVLVKKNGCEILSSMLKDRYFKI
ncbi:MAG: Xaa-Pro peptidase family protein [Calditerrivibrio sp.]|nr:Xaa-Pro peptidase family protein [Calditerrivibrio sp.]MCA1981132.1 Xaa-Pro peptidase family protein [Calditerrivibrio sp.]